MPNNPKKVAVLLPSLQVGGAERLVLEELAVLKDDPRFAVELHLVFEKGPFFQNAASLGVPIHIWNAPHKSILMLKNYIDIIMYLRRTHCDILHNHLLDAIGPLVGRMAGAKVVATVHNDKPYTAIEKVVLSTSDLVLGCGQQVMKNIRGFVPDKKAGVLNNAIRKPENTGVRKDDVLQKFGLGGKSKLIVSLGRLTRQKGYDVLIEAFRKVSAEVPDAVLLIAGDGEEKGCLATLIKSFGLTENIKLPGMVAEIHELLAACDLYVNSSRWEGLPMTLLEAIAHGKPMVATSVGGNPEVVYEGVTGFLVPPEDAEKLAHAIIRMLKDDCLRDQASRAALSLFTEKYTIERHCRTLSEYYLQVLDNKMSLHLCQDDLQ